MFAKRYKLEALKEKYSSENKIKKVQKICTKLKKIDEHLLPIKNRIQTGEQAFTRTDKIFVRFEGRSDKLRFD